MPASRSKNLLYRAALPFLSPAVPADPVVSVKGHTLASEKKLLRLIRRNHISGAALCLQSGSETSMVFTRAVHTDLIPDEHTYFRVASITKTATALLCTHLMDRGLLDPDKPVCELRPGCAGLPELEGIRLRHLLSHTSGLSDPQGLEELLLKKTPLPEALSGCRKHEPGETFLYSNLAFGLIGSLLESVFGRPVEKIFREYLFQLRLNATLAGSSIPADRIIPVIRMLPHHAGSSIRVTRLGRFPLDCADPLHHYGYTAGSMYIEPESLLRLTACVRDGGAPLLSPRYMDYMKKEVVSYGAVSPTLSYGFGLLIVRDRRISDSTVFGHQGFAYGCVDGAFWEESTGNILISVNGGCSEARTGRFGIANLDLCRWAFRKELPLWK